MDIAALEDIIKNRCGREFETFKEMLQKYNKMYNLTAITDDEGIFYKHFLDSAAGEEYFFKGANVAEIGSGGGFPSLPLKIIRDDLKFTLIESTGRAEDGARDKNLREKFDVVCARAVAALNTLSEYCLPYVKTGGRFIAYKGDCGEEIEIARKAICLLGGEIEEVKRYRLENCGERTLVIVRKVKSTPALYPRGNGKERKIPL